MLRERELEEASENYAALEEELQTKIEEKLCAEHALQMEKRSHEETRGTLHQTRLDLQEVCIEKRDLEAELDLVNQKLSQTRDSLAESITEVKGLGRELEVKAEEHQSTILQHQQERSDAERSNLAKALEDSRMLAEERIEARAERSRFARPPPFTCNPS